MGGKTGYTWAAKQTYVGKFSRNGDEILVAILGSRNMWNDIAKLVEYGFNKKQKIRIANRDQDDMQKPKSSPSANTDLVVLSESKKFAKL
jgi:D-alanyl-D-alanine carboxypeptidase (penicillin-binding protein 5/6)